jgi:outer membrane protein assembly factor BamB
MILNALNGTVVFDSRAAGLVEVQGKYVMPRSGGLLIVGFKTGNLNTQLAMHDIATGKQRWHSEVLSEGMNKMTNLLFTIAQVSFDIQAVHAEPVELGDGSILFGAMGAVFRIDAATGEPLWKTEAGNARVLHMTDLIPGRVFVGSEEGDDSSPYYSTFQALDLESGEPAWDKPVRVRGALNPLFISSDRGLIVSERTQGKGRIRLLDHDTGESLWGKKGKGIKVKGGIVDYDFSAAGFVVTTGYDSAWNDKGTEYLLYVVDTRTGALRFKDPLKVKGRMLQTELLEHGLLYVTTHEVNVFSVETGKLLNEHLVRGKKPIATRWHGDHLYAFNTQQGQLFRLDRRNAELERVSSAKTTLDGKDTPLEIDVRGDEIILTGHQNVIGFGQDGNVRFSAYHPAPQHHGVVQALLWAQAVRAAMASVDTGVAGAAFTAASADVEQGTIAHELTSGLGQSYVEASEDLAGIAGDYAREARKRFQASATSRDFVFMMVRQDKKLALAQVSKSDGQIVALIDMGKDEEPSYQVDDVGDRIFYRASDTAITAYDFAATSVASSGL